MRSLWRSLRFYETTFACRSFSPVVIHLVKIHSCVILKRDYPTPHSDDESHVRSRGHQSSKQILQAVYDSVMQHLGTEDVCPVYVTENISEKSKKPLWRARLKLKWPQSLVIEGTGVKKVDAERAAALHAVRKLKNLQVLDDHNRPIFLEQPVEEVPFLKEFEAILPAPPKVVLQNVFQVVCNTYGSSEFKPNYKTRLKPDRRLPSWETVLSLSWPKPECFSGVSRHKVDAEKLAALKALKHIQESGMLDPHFNPVINSAKEISEFRHKQKAVQMLQVDKDLVEEMHSVVEQITRLNLNCDTHSSSSSVKNVHYSLNENVWETDDENELPVPIQHIYSVEDNSTIDREGPIMDVITGLPYRCPASRVLEARNLELYRKLTELRLIPGVSNYKSSFTIASKKDAIMDLIEKNRVVLLVGETGCGKTTQMPQYILEAFVDQLEGAACNIVVTQPRRISASSIARNVAKERYESLGDTIGYQVRLDGVIPQKPGRILFCSTGILLRRLLMNPTLQGVSHVIVDEVHERDMLMDFLLILLRDLVRSGRNPDLRIVLMSATLDFEKLSDYFDKCPIYHVDGFLYPVTEKFLPSIETELQLKYKAACQKPFSVDTGSLVELVTKLDATRPKGGAILVFLPGWKEILTVMKQLRERFPSSTTHRILPVHSKIDPKDQAKIFEIPPAHVRKIILATNIAETSITINDVVYVVDCGLHRELHFNAEHGIAVLDTTLITKSNVKQRRGRAGRTQPGECYHLYPSEMLDIMREFPVPEMQRAPLETTILDAKAYFPEKKATEFLLKAPDPPNSRSIRRAVRDLVFMGILDSEENLTPLGKRVLFFNIHPRMGKAVVLSSLLQCVDTVTTIAAVMSNNRDMFLARSIESNDVKTMKQYYDHECNSDHILFANAYNSWQNIYSEKKSDVMYDYCDKHCLNVDSLLFTRGLKSQLINALDNAHLPNFSRGMHDENILLTKAVLAAALSPNMLFVRSGSVKKGRILPHTKMYLNLFGTSVAIQGSSINALNKQGDTSWLVYFHSLHSTDRRCEVVRDTTAVPFLALLLFAGKQLTITKTSSTKEMGHSELSEENALVAISIDRSSIFRCHCSARTANTIVAFRSACQTFFNYLLLCPERLIEKGKLLDDNDDNQTKSQGLHNVHQRIVDVVAALLDENRNSASK